MMTSISITPAGHYEVSVYLRDGNGYGRWHILRTFAEQGDARQFAFEDCPKFSDTDIKGFVQTFSSAKVFRRQGFKKYTKYE